MVIGCLVILFAVANYIAIPFQEWAGRSGPAFMKPEYFPSIVLIVMAILGLILILGAIFSKSYQPDLKSASPRVIFSIAVAFAYAFFFDLFPFFVTTTITTFILAFFLGERRPVLLITLPLSLTVLLYFSTTYGLKIILP